MLKISNLTVQVDSKIIFDNLNFTINSTQKTFLTGKNGTGKSTLAQVIIGNPSYKIISGNIFWNDLDITNLTPEDRSKSGIFVSFQSPIEIPGLSLLAFCKEIILANSDLENTPSSKQIISKVQNALELVGLDKSFLTRDLNLNCSGGEKKKIELLQLLILDPQLIILDEIEAGLDIQFLDEFIRILRDHILKPNKTVIIITHNPRLIQAFEDIAVIDIDNLKTPKTPNTN